MTYIETREINGKKYYYKSKSVRTGEKVGKVREYLGTNLNKEELSSLIGNKNPPKNKNIFDINKLPAQEGILFFGISISRMSNSQSAKECFRYIEDIFIPKITKPAVGLNVVYSDNLYLYSDSPANTLKNKHQALINSHKNEFLKILGKNKWYIPKSFNFITWSQLLLESKEFPAYFGEIQKLYYSDKNFQKYVKEDIGKENITKNQIMFILEEILVFYLVTKGKIRLVNEYVEDKQKWILNCYPGKPLKSEIYLYQKNPFNLNNSGNKYENSFYDLSSRKLYDYLKIDLEKDEL